jgi:iron complex outermembrane recepter protein
MSQSNNRQGSAACLRDAVALALGLATFVAAAAPVPFAIDARDAGSAIAALEAQAGIVVHAEPALLAGRQVKPLRGSFEPARALGLLAAEAGLAVRRLGDGEFVLERSAVADAGREPLLLASLDSPPAPKAAPAELETVVVTGSYLRRTDAETPSPVEVIDAGEILKSGKTTISDVIRTVSADNSGSLTQNFSGALAGGASGVSLRGLTVDATLVLVDGHRMAPYPLADDGQRPFVDLSSLPLGIVERVEILKDGASAIYGSDAIAGVVNILLKKEYQGFEVNTSLGGSYRADGLSQRVSLLYGTGDYASEGHNVYFNVEYRHSASINQLNRPNYLSDSDLRPYGGPDRRGGIIQQDPPNNATFTEVGQVAPLYAQQAGNNPAGYFLLPGCKTSNLNYSGGCTWNPNGYNKIQPRTAGLNLTAHWSEALGDGWKNTLTASFSDSQAEAYKQSDFYSTGPTTIPYTWAGAKGTVVDQTDPATTRIVLPATSLDNPFNPKSPYFDAAKAFYGANFASFIGQPALFSAALTDFPAQVINFDTSVIRLVDDVTGTAGGWNLAGSVGYVRVATHETYDGFIRASRLDAALADGSYRVGANAYLNSPKLYAYLAPQTTSTATSELAYISVNAAHDLWELPGGPVGLALGADARYLKLDNPGEPYAPEGDIIGDGSAYAFGSQTVEAAFVELSAPVLKSLEFSAAGRVDHYNGTGSSFTPKLGFKWKIIPELAVRGTFARGFRAPGIAEAGNSGTGTATSNPASDPLRCPYTQKPSDCGQGFIATQSNGNPNLKPEKSKSYTFGLIFEPVKRVNLTADYFHIRRDGEIVPAPLGLETVVRGAQQPGTNYPGPILYYQSPYVNAAYSDTSGVDAALHVEFPLGGLGRLTMVASTTYLLKAEQTFEDPVNGNATYHYAGTVGPTVVGGAVGTPRQRGQFTLDWTRGDLSVGTTINYRSAMRGIDESSGGNTCIQLSDTNPHCYVAGFTYADVYAQYFQNDHLQWNLNVTNVTNRLAPLNTATYGGTNYNPSLDQAGGVGRYYELGLRYKY